MQRRYSHGYVIISALLFAALCSGPRLAAAEEAQAKAAKVVFDNPIYDFGTVSQGTHVTHDFVVRNGGDGDLAINRVVASCGCTATSATSDLIKPGDSTTVHVDFDTSGFSGEKVKTVRVFTNDGKEPSTILTLRGTIQPDVMVTPPRLVFGEVIKDGKNQSFAQQVTVKVRPDSPLKIVGIKSFSPYLEVRDDETSAKERTFNVILKPDAPLGELRDRIIVSLEGGERTSINLPVLAVVEGPIRLKPATLSFGIIEGTSELKKTSTLEGLGSEKISIVGVSVDHPAVRVDYTTLEPGKRYAINVHVDPKKIERDLKTSVSVNAVGSSAQTLSLSIYGMSPPKAKS